jgi:starvation-inducible DNA-binding protein
MYLILKGAIMDIGINQKDRKKVADGLSKFLADTYTLYLKTHYFHWNVTGPQFRTLHLMFEEQYNELWLATDAIAERIRSLDFYAPGTYRDFSHMTSIKETESVPNAQQMVAALTEGHETVARVARELVAIADKVSDEATADLATQRLQIHEKTAWMLRSLLEKNPAHIKSAKK